MRIQEPVAHIKKLCRKLGSQYSIKVIDLEPVIYRDFHNGYDVEVSGLNHNSDRARTTIYLWKDKSEIVRTLERVEQEKLGQAVEELYRGVGDCKSLQHTRAETVAQPYANFR